MTITSLSANDDFISLDFDDLPTVDADPGSSNNIISRKRKRLQDEGDDHDDHADLSIFPWLPFKRSGTSSPRPSVKKM